MNIIIPIGGLAEIFKNNGYTTPKPLINIFGKPMIFYVIDNLVLNKEDNLIIIYNKELNNFNFNKLIKERYNNINLIELTKQTEGAAETVLIGLNNINQSLLNNKCVLLDCDTFYIIDILSIYRKQEDNRIFCFKDLQDNQIFSYVKINDNNNIYDIKEKIKISEIANTGCYCFKDGHILKKYCDIVITKNIREKNEFFISCVIKEMLNNNFEFKYNLLNYNDFNCVGTPTQLKIFCSNFNNNIEKKRFCFDLDNTLVSMPIIKNDYTTVIPITKNIEYLRFLKKLGNHIIIYTSRKMETYNGNMGMILKDIAQITFNTLEKFDIPYDEIFFGKPSADFYIEELAINVYDDLEKKIGIYKTSIQERDFNEIKDDKLDIIIKKSNNTKLQGEIYYYLNIPIEIKKYFPIFIDYGSDWYSLQKINGITMSYLYVNESLTEDIFYKYLSLFRNIHTLKYDDSKISVNIYENYNNKIKLRYNNYDYTEFENSEKIYNILINYFEKYESNNKGIKGIIHGDAVFSNCIIDYNDNFKLIDMRGKLSDLSTIYGDILYDYAKIYQSLIGYDEILLNKILSNEYKKNLLNIFILFIKEHLGDEYLDIIKMITNSLLFTLIPLHKNGNCNDFYKLINIGVGNPGSPTTPPS